MTGDRLNQLTYFRGRVALYAILKGLGVGRGEEVAVQAFTCLAVPEAVLAVGARPLYVDVEPGGFNMDAGDLRRKISTRTRAVVVQHTFGIPADMASLLRAAGAAGLPVIEDCCHALHGAYAGRPLGTLGAAAFYSFEWGKPLVAGVGGAAVANERRLAEVMRRQYGTYRFPGWMNRLRLQLQYAVFSFAYRPESYWLLRELFRRLSRAGAAEGNYHALGAEGSVREFQWRMGVESARRLRRELAGRREPPGLRILRAAQYRRWIASTRALHPRIPPEAAAVLVRYPLRVPDKQRLLALAREARLELADWYATPVHPLKDEAYGQAGYVQGSCPNAEARAAEVVSLPTHRRVRSAYVRSVCELINKAA